MNLRLTAKRCFYYSAITLFCTILSCTRDSYEKGEGKYSQMRGDFLLLTLLIVVYYIIIR